MFSLFFSGSVTTCCLGAIGSSKFCLKNGLTSGACGVQSHEVKKFALAKDAFYLKENEGRAFMKPCYTVSELTPRLVEVLLSQSLPLKEWEGTFDALNQGILPDWLKEAEGVNVWVTTSMQESRNHEKIGESLELESPRVAMESLGIFQDAPMLSFEDDMDEAGDADDLSPKRMSLWIKEFQRRFASIKSKWGKTFSDVEASHIVVVKDLQKLQHAASEVITALGKPTVNGVFPQGTSVWRGLSSVADSLSDQTITISAVSDSVEVLQKAHSDLHQTFIESGEEHESSQRTVTERLHFLERCSQTFEQRFSKILPMLISFKKRRALFSNE